LWPGKNEKHTQTAHILTPNPLPARIIMQYHAIMLMFINEKIKLNKDLFCSWHVALTSQCEMRQDVTGMTPI
jgi:hypothetical protein